MRRGSSVWEEFLKLWSFEFLLQKMARVVFEIERHHSLRFSNKKEVHTRSRNICTLFNFKI